MATNVPIQSFLAAGLPVLDVRSPGEFAHGHIPGAANLPLFTDAERAKVGTLYKQEGRDAAMLQGLRFVGPRMADLVEQARTMAPGGRVGVHCWRGGQRSASVAWLLEKAGMEVLLLEHGYKAFRQHVLQSFGAPWNLRILGGYTGTGKTALLSLLREGGEQVVDLEGLARHKGSSFGGIGQGAQPTTEQFENLVWSAFRQLDPVRPIWLEDESQMVGRVKVPDELFARMRTAPVSFVDMPMSRRVEHLVADYGSFPQEELAAATQRIQKRLGPQHAQDALAALSAGDLHRVAAITLTYYDKTYARGLAARNPATVHRIEAGSLSPAGIAQLLIASHERHETP